MKNILCYGDSLTWGAAPQGGRHSFHVRWPSVLNRELGATRARVFADGLGGRTTMFDDFASAADRNGARTLPTSLGVHQPLDCVIIMLGTNDLKSYGAANAFASAMGMKRLTEIVRTFPYQEGFAVPRVVLVAPPHCVETTHDDLRPMFDGAVEKSCELAFHYERIARELGAAFFDAARVASASPVDGVHLDEKNTIAIGKGLAPLVRNLLK